MKALKFLVPAAAVACLLSPALAQTNADNKQPGAKQPAKPEAQKPEAPKTEAPKTEPKTEAPAVEKVAWVELKTSMGNIVVELDGEKAPLSTANFLTYVTEGYYDGTVFHRIISNFMIQGGGFTTTGSSPNVSEKHPTHPAIKNEWKNGLKNKRGTIAMARTSAPDSATSQFYINVADNDGTVKFDLDHPQPGSPAAYAVFGKVISGMDVVDKIKAVKTGNHPMGDVPDAPVVIEKARKLTEAEAKAVKKDDAKPAAPAPAPVIKPAPAPAPNPTAPAPKPAGGGGG